MSYSKTYVMQYIYSIPFKLILYGEFDGLRNKRVLVKIIGE